MKNKQQANTQSRVGIREHSVPLSCGSPWTACPASSGGARSGQARSFPRSRDWASTYQTLARGYSRDTSHAASDRACVSVRTRQTREAERSAAATSRMAGEEAAGPWAAHPERPAHGDAVCAGASPGEQGRGWFTGRAVRCGGCAHAVGGGGGVFPGPWGSLSPSLSLSLYYMWKPRGNQRH